VILADALVIALYVWLISIGTWVRWPGNWHVYDALADAFRHGQLAVAERPDPALLALGDPYDPAARTGIPYPQDLSLFDRRYYVYFGPVPALILLPFKALIPRTVGDQYLVLPFVAGILLVESWLLAGVWRRFFTALSPWLLAPSILTIGLVNPWPWILSTPSVHDAAITGGVFFLLLAITTGFLTLQSRAPSSLRLALAGVLCAAAVGTRLTLLVPVAFLSTAIAWSLVSRYHETGNIRQALPLLLAFAMPVGIGAAALAWYNWARFGSVVETGFRFALAAGPIHEHMGELFSPLYVVQNLYNYSLNPFTLKYPFPYFNPARGETESLLSFIALPAIYHKQEMSGLLYAAPFAVLALLPVVGVLRKPWSLPRDPEAQSPRWLAIVLLGWFLCSFALMLAYFWAAERFFVEFMSPLLLLSVIGYFQLDAAIAKRPRALAALRIVTGLLALAAVVTSILVSMSFNADGFRHLNPVLWRQLSNLFRP
jgi:hypothetical protein